jgi:hypothetical protein
LGEHHLSPAPGYFCRRRRDHGTVRRRGNEAHCAAAAESGEHAGADAICGRSAEQSLGVAVIPGNGQWTIIKTAPFELLGERAPGCSRMRIVELAGRLRVPGFQLNVHDGSDAVMVETDGRGRCLLSGFTGYGVDPDDPLLFHEERLSGDRIIVGFELLPLEPRMIANPDPATALIDYHALAGSLAAALAGANSSWRDNMTCLDLIEHKPLPISGAHDLYFEWPARDRSFEWPGGDRSD